MSQETSLLTRRVVAHSRQTGIAGGRRSGGAAGDVRRRIRRRRRKLRISTRSSSPAAASGAPSPWARPVTTVSREDIELAAPLTTSALIQQAAAGVQSRRVREFARTVRRLGQHHLRLRDQSARHSGPMRRSRCSTGIAPCRRAPPDSPSILRSFPTLALGRVEVVADGASALYGSDAVAGVVNLILRRDFEGVEVSMRGGSADEYERAPESARSAASAGRAATRCWRSKIHITATSMAPTANSFAAT